MQSFKDQCITLRKNDLSILEIAKITGKSKSTIYPYIKNIPLSSKKQKQITQAAGEHIRQFALARKGKSTRSFIPFELWTQDAVLLVAHFIFDGSLMRTQCSYNSRSPVLLRRVEELMKNIYIYEPKKYINKKTGVWRISYHNVALGVYLQEKAQELIGFIEQAPKSLQKEFLRAFFDDEGCMDFRPSRNHRRVRGYQKNIKTLFLIQKLLKNFSIDSHIEMPNEIVISGKENLLKFQEEINFSFGVRINGKRSNSLWKKSLEKRKILEMAIQSYVL